MHGDEVMTLEEQQRRDDEAKREVVAKLGSLRGFEGVLVDTNIPCPVCESQNLRTLGGSNVRLHRRADGSLWCHHHGVQET